MNSHYTKTFEHSNEEPLPSDIIFAEMSGSQDDKEQPLSADSFWNFSEENAMLFTGFDSSNHTSEASDFPSFSELSFNENPSSIFNSSLEMFSGDREHANGAHEHVQNSRENLSQQSENDSADLLPLEGLSEFYDNPLIGGEAEGSLDWSFDILESSRPMRRLEDDHQPFSAYPVYLDTSREMGEHIPTTNQNFSSLQHDVEGFQQSLPTSAPLGNTNVSQVSQYPEAWRQVESAGSTKSMNGQIPWEWHSFEYKQTNNKRSNTSLSGGKPETETADSQMFKSSNESLGKESNGEPNTDEMTNKKDRRKAKPIAKRFQPVGTVTVVPSYVQCLNIVLDYHGYTGIINRIILNNAITNVAYQQHDTSYRASLVRKHLVEYYSMPEHEELVGALPSADIPASAISLISGVLQRKIHMRDISSIIGSVHSIAYVKSGRFSIHNPYEPQYYRYELDAKGKAVNESKCGMCAFCPTVKFLPFKNSSYLSHMTLEHGIFASNFVVPEGLYYGKYRMVRSTDPSKTRTVKALQCPACFQVIEVACWKNKTNPLLSYFRHFKKLHSNLNKTFTSSTIDPVTLKHRGGSISHGEGAAPLERHEHI
ncbi:hypothetical protein OXX59_007049 [Metschnikowia pulcherrima]